MPGERSPRLRPRGPRSESEVGPALHRLPRALPDEIVQRPTLGAVRVVSLVPAATEIVYAIGAIDELVAVTHDDDYPPTVRVLPSVTHSTIPHGASAREIDRQVREAGSRGESTFHLDEQALRDARPDVILGQTLCAVCAVTLDQIPAHLPRTPQVVSLDASSIDGMFEDVRRIGAALGRDGDAERLIHGLESRLAAVEARVTGRARPRVACLEWLDPLFNAGHWVPEQVTLAGGRDVLGQPGVPSIDIEIERLVAADPDYVFVMPCGFDVERALMESRALRKDPRWTALRAVREARAFVLDGNAYFSRPGPRVVDGIELLASILHPDRVSSDIRRIPL